MEWCSRAAAVVASFVSTAAVSSSAADVMTVDEAAVPECVVRIPVFLAIGHPRHCSCWVSREPGGGPVGIGAGGEGHCACGETGSDSALPVIGESRRSPVRPDMSRLALGQIRLRYAYVSEEIQREFWLSNLIEIH